MGHWTLSGPVSDKFGLVLIFWTIAGLLPAVSLLLPIVPYYPLLGSRWRYFWAIAGQLALVLWPYNPWDKGTRREPLDDEHTFAKLLKEFTPCVAWSGGTQARARI